MEKKNIEKGVFLKPFGITQKDIASAGSFDVLYLGSFFCQNILPLEQDIKTALKCKVKNIAIATSFVNEDMFSGVVSRVKRLIKICPEIEFIVNDMGLLDYLNKKHPKIKKSIGIPLSIEFMRMTPRLLWGFMKKHKIRAIETDEENMLGNFPEDRNFEIRFHYPFKFSAMSRFCPFTRKISEKCAFECFRKSRLLAIPKTDAKLVGFQNAYLTFDKKIPSSNIDRAVFNLYCRELMGK